MNLPFTIEFDHLSSENTGVFVVKEGAWGMEEIKRCAKKAGFDLTDNHQIETPYFPDEHPQLDAPFRIYSRIFKERRHRHAILPG